MDIVSKAKDRRVIFLSGDVHVGMIDVRPPGCHLPYESIGSEVLESRRCGGRSST